MSTQKWNHRLPLSQRPRCQCGRPTFDNELFSDRPPVDYCEVCQQTVEVCSCPNYRKLEDLKGESWVAEKVVLLRVAEVSIFKDGRWWFKEAYPWHEDHGFLLRVSKEGIYRCPECHVGGLLVEVPRKHHG